MMTWFDRVLYRVGLITCARAKRIIGAILDGADERANARAETALTAERQRIQEEIASIRRKWETTRQIVRGLAVMDIAMVNGMDEWLRDKLNDEIGRRIDVDRAAEGLPPLGDDT